MQELQMLKQATQRAQAQRSRAQRSPNEPGALGWLISDPVMSGMQSVGLQAPKGASFGRPHSASPMPAWEGDPAGRGAAHRNIGILFYTSQLLQATQSDTRATARGARPLSSLPALRTALGRLRLLRDAREAPTGR